MLDVSEKVGMLLNDICNSVNYTLDFYFIHAPQGANLPCIVYNELSNTDHDYYTGMEVSNIIYEFIIFSHDPELIFDLRQMLDATLYENGFLKKSVSQVSYIEPYYVQSYHYSIRVHQHYNK